MVPKTFTEWLLVAVLIAGAADPCAAQSDAPKSTLPGGPLGLSHYAQDRWGIVGVGAANPGDRPVDVLSTLYFGGDPRLQFGRDLWIPPRARRTSWHPVLPPRDMPLDKSTVIVRSLLIDRSGEREVILKNPGGQMLYESYLPVQRDSATAVISDGDAEDIVTALMLARFERRLSSRIVRSQGDSLPPTMESLQALDHVLVCSDRLASDAAGIVALRRWLYDGGNLWIALDRVAPETVSLLLGNRLACHVVDRVPLTEWRIVGTSFRENEQTGTAPLQRIGDFEHPVEMVRVEAPGMRVSYTVNGWPAAMSLPAGKGTVLLTTLGGRGWVRPRLKQDGPAFEPQHPVAGLVATGPLRQLAFEFLKRHAPPTLEARAWDTLVSEQVGYRIVGRTPVAGVLGVFCVGLLLLGLRLTRRDRLAHLGWLGPACAVAAALILVFMGAISRRSVPATVAVGQFVEVAPQVDDVRVSGLLAFYTPQESREPLGVSDGGMVFPDAVQENKGETQRMVWTDLDQWHWENLSLPAGLHLMPFEYATKAARPLAARATFGPYGVTGTFEVEPFQEAADALIAIPGQRHLGVRLGKGGTFVAGSEDVLEVGQFLSAQLLSDEQRRRRSIYQKLLGDPNRHYPSQPTLLTWAAPLDMRFTFPKEARQTGDALLAIPLEFQQAPPGTRVLIPSPFLSPRPVRMEDAASSWYSPGLNTWLGASQRGGHMMLRYQMPAAVLPLRLGRARLSLSMTAPSRRLTITTVVDEKIVPVATRDGPVGTIRFELGADALRLDAKGGLFLGIKIGETSPTRDWKINELQLEIEGTALEPGES